VRPIKRRLLPEATRDIVELDEKSYNLFPECVC
jgi:hypothetical protein